ncbi:DUF4190 domain-containing protein [Amycolatopsis sp. NEAU-NG30]|uniref:DUF4190 domain-containing protein n=1 Tax=Amycolatopsis melonis TaxID=3156488 RepID=A0ABV0LNM4_9PSEU
MTDPSGEKDRPAAGYEPPPTADPAPYAPENYDPPAADPTLPDTAAQADTAFSGTGSADTVSAEQPGSAAADAAAEQPGSSGSPFPGTGSADQPGSPFSDTAYSGTTTDQPGFLPPGSFETPAAHIPGTPYVAPGQPQAVPPYPPQYPPAYGQSYVTPPSYPAAASRQDNALAIGALVCSILGFCSGVTAIAGLVMGHIALSRTNRGEGGGRGLATAAVIVGYVVIALWVGFFTTLIILGATGHLA